MKIKLVLTTLVLAGFQSFYAQETPVRTTTTIKASDSIYVGTADLEKQKVEQRALLDKQLKDDQKALKEQRKIDGTRKDAEASLKREQRKVEREQHKLNRAQRTFEKEQNKLASAEKSLAKNRRKLADANKDLLKIQAKQTKNLGKGSLSPVEVEKGNLKITKQQLKIKEIEEDIENAQQKLDKLR